MNRKSTTARNIVESIKNKMVEVEEVELNFKNMDKSEIIESNVFVNELRNFSNLDLFCDSIDFEYEFICKDKEIDNERLMILCGYKNYKYPYYINFILKLNKDVCKSLVDLEQVLVKK